MGFSFTFSPLLPTMWLLIIMLPLGFLAFYGLINNSHGAWPRFLFCLLLALSLLNPSFIRRYYEPLKTVVALVTDRTTSQKLDKREEQTDTLHNSAVNQIKALKDFELRKVEVKDQLDATSDISSAVFNGLKSAFTDVPAKRIGGAVIITDGQVHDIPENLNNIGFQAPLHVILTGNNNEQDRYIELVKTPSFGVVNELLEFQFRVHETGFKNSKLATVSIFANGKEISSKKVMPGSLNYFQFRVPHSGKSTLEFRAKAEPNEITSVNNQAFSIVNGIREDLRVLLISGVPHSGQRAWRNLLKSDASIDLVHFTILRSLEKQDNTPINELSLIAFPVHELFVEKINEFDLIIFDRYSIRNVLPMLYFDSIVRYVLNGGAILISAGPEFAKTNNIASQTPLSKILPAIPNGRVYTEPYRAKISKTGNRHPVTRKLYENETANNPPWSKWFRSIGVSSVSGKTIMTGFDDQPLLIIDKVGKGRVGLLLSDHIWLWARGFEGGGPYIQLLRRLSHWLMKEPDLEEEQLNAKSDRQNLIIERQTLSDKVSELTVTKPSGKQYPITLKKIDNGMWQARTKTDEIGLYKVQSDDLVTFTSIGPAAPREFSEVISTASFWEPVVQKTGGKIIRTTASQLPSILAVKENEPTFGYNWIGLQKKNVNILTSIKSVPLFGNIFSLALLLICMAIMWLREGR